jgi:perosamine synthetase
MEENKDLIPVCEPLLNGNELKYVTEAVTTGWISSSGPFVRKFEEGFARYCGARYGVGVCNGTTALHLAVVSLGLGSGDEVVIPDFTMASTAFALCYAGAMPVFVDAEPDTWNIDPRKIEEKITPRTKAIMAVSLFGHPCDMDQVQAIADRHGLIVVEDAAESHGAEYRGRKTGSLARVTAFSFFANKNLTTGEGGMVVTDDEDLYRKCLYYRNVCFPPDEPRNYRHDDIGFNYRLSNLHAAIGLAQVEKADDYCRMRIHNHGLYRKHLDGIGGVTLQATRDTVLHVPWMNGMVVDPDAYGRTRDELMEQLARNNIETRLFFLGMHRQPALLKYGCDGSGNYPVSDGLADNGMYLPSASGLREEQIRHICRIIREFQR